MITAKKTVSVVVRVNGRKIHTYIATTKWSDHEGNVFFRKHVRRSANKSGAKLAERNHNDQRMYANAPYDMAEDGWKYKIVSIERADGISEPQLLKMLGTGQV